MRMLKEVWYSLILGCENVAAFVRHIVDCGR
jgi:hypothetical protein